MGISGCTSCQVGGPEALKAYDQAYAQRRIAETAVASAPAKIDNPGGAHENRPIVGAVVGSQINIKV